MHRLDADQPHTGHAWLTPVNEVRRPQRSIGGMRRVAMLALLLVAACASPPQDFSSLVSQEGGAVVKVGAYSAPPAQETADPGDLEDDDPEREIIERLIGGLGAPSGPNLGSGFVISEDGYIVTNAHLVADAAADSVMVRLADRRDFKARVIGADNLSDIALLKIEAHALPRVRLGDPRRLEPGQWVAAIGSPLGLERTVTAGIVSAVGRTLPEESYFPFIQTDVAINPGNSGGPLFNLRGEVIGVNSVIYSMSGGFMGLSFAVPIDVAMSVVSELKAHGKVTRGRIGVRLQDLTPELAAALRVPEGSGALVVDLMKGGPAERADLRSADVVVSFAGQPVRSHVELMRLVAGTAPGQTVEIGYMRNGVAARAHIAVEETTPTRVATPPASIDPVGILVEPLSRQRRARLGLDSGVLVYQSEGAAQRAGLEPGDIILSVNGVPVVTPYAFHERLRAAGKGAAVALLVMRDGTRAFVALRLPE